MKKIWLACLVACFLSAAMAQSSPSGLAQLAWLAGEWRLEKANGRIIEEQWSKPAAGIMLGTGRTYSKDKLVEFEFVRIVERDGKLVYIAQPNGQPPTEFVAAKVSTDEVVFENLQHDFPKRVMYKKVSDKCVTAAIDGGEGTKKIEFPYCRP
jgi:hypothetical protein